MLTGAALVVLVAILLFSLQNPIALDDGLRHFAMGQRLLEKGLTGYGWQQFFTYGYLGSHSVDPWFLSDVLYGFLSPLGVDGSLKAFTLLSIAALIGVFLWVFRAWKLPVWTQVTLLILLLTFQPNFLYRMLLPRPFMLITALTMFVLVSMLLEKPILAGIGVLFATWFSQLFIFPLTFALGMCVWLWFRGNTREAWMAGGIVVGECIMGMLLRPDPIAFIQYLGEAFIRIPFAKITLESEMQTGLPMVPWVGIIVMITLYLQWSLSRRAYSVRQSWKSGLLPLTVLTLTLFVIFFFWSRAIDFLWPVAVLTLGLTLSESFRKRTPTSFRSSPLRLLTVSSAFLLCFMNVSGIVSILQSTDASRNLEVFHEALTAVPTGSTVLNPDWQLFAPAVTVRPDLRFAMGIDPTFTLIDNARTSSLLGSITQGELEDPLEALREIQSSYPSDYLVLFRGLHEELIAEITKTEPDLSQHPLLAIFRLPLEF